MGTGWTAGKMPYILIDSYYNGKNDENKWFIVEFVIGWCNFFNAKDQNMMLMEMEYTARMYKSYGCLIFMGHCSKNLLPPCGRHCFRKWKYYWKSSLFIIQSSQLDHFYTLIKKSR